VLLEPRPPAQVVVGTVVQADKRSVLVDVGYKSLQRFFRSELTNAPIYSQDGGNRGVPTELMVRGLAQRVAHHARQQLKSRAVLR